MNGETSKISTVVLACINAALCWWIWTSHLTNQNLLKQLKNSKPVDEAKVVTAEAPVIPEPSPPAEKATTSERIDRTDLSALLKVNSAWRAQHDATVQAQEYYGLALESLGLPPPTLSSVKNLLVEYLKKGATNRADEDAFYAGIRELVGADEMKKIKRMMAASDELYEIKSSYSPYLSFIGAPPLTGDQALSLAESFKNAYDDPMYTSKTLDDAINWRTQEVDESSGLSAPDREVIMHLSTVLSPVQISGVTARLKQITAKYLEVKNKAK